MKNPYILLHEQKEDGCVVLRGVIDVREVAYAALDEEEKLWLTFRGSPMPSVVVIHKPEGGITAGDLLEGIYALKKVLLKEPVPEPAPWWAPWRK